MRVLVNDFQRAQTLAVLPVAVRESGQHTQHIEVALDLLFNAGSQDLNDNFRPVLELRGMHLCDRRGGQWLLCRKRSNTSSTDSP